MVLFINKCDAGLAERQLEEDEDEDEVDVSQFESDEDVHQSREPALVATRYVRCAMCDVRFTRLRNSQCGSTICDLRFSSGFLCVCVCTCVRCVPRARWWHFKMRLSQWRRRRQQQQLHNEGALMMMMMIEEEEEDVDELGFIFILQEEKKEN